MRRNPVSLRGLMIATLAAALPALAVAEEPVWKDGQLQPLADGFPNAPITLINVDDAGTNSGIYVRALQEAIKDMSPVEIRISDEPRAAGGTINTLAEVAEDREGGKDGYFAISMSIIGSATDFLSEPITKETGVKPEDVNYMISTEVVPWLFTQRSDAPWGNDFAKFVEHAKANPGQVKYIAPGNGSGTDIYMTWLLDQLGLEVNKIPAEDREASTAAVAGGAGDITMTQPAVVLAAGDRVKVLLLSTPQIPDAFAGPGVVSSADYSKFGIEDVAWGTYNGVMVPGAVPAEHVAWLHALLTKATETDSYKKRVETVPGLVISVLSTEDANAFATKAIAAAEPIVRKAGLHWEDNQ
jgi:tripartite-type tricarboxylate transporter receptor subunit TctC